MAGCKTDLYCVASIIFSVLRNTFRSNIFVQDEMFEK